MNPTESTMYFTEQSGVHDLAIEAARRLFIEYLGGPKSDSIFSREFRPERHLWHGIVMPSTGFDFSVVSRFQILTLPVDFKFHSHGKLIPLAHEASHVVFDVIDSLEETRARFVADVLGPWITAAIDIADITWSVSAERSAEVRGEVIDELERCLPDHKNARPLARLELLCDVFGAIGAGPAYYASVFPYLTRARQPRRDDSRLRRHLPRQDPARPDMDTSLPYWIRNRTGIALGRALGWFQPDSPGDSDPWEIFRYMAESHVRHDQSDIALEQHIRLKDYGPLWSRRPWYYLMRALEEIPELACAICRFTEGVGDDYLFYPFVDDDKEREAIRHAVNALCENTMARMMFNDEVVMDVNAKYLAAATMLPPYGRPHHSPSRSLHSLFYSEAKRTTSIQRALKRLPQHARIEELRSAIHSDYEKK